MARRKGPPVTPSTVVCTASATSESGSALKVVWYIFTAAAMAWASPSALVAWAAGRSSWTACFWPSHPANPIRTITMARGASRPMFGLQHAGLVLTERMRSGELPRHQDDQHQEEPGSARGE